MAGLPVRALNFFEIENLFDRAACGRRRAAMRHAPSESAIVDVDGVIDEQ